jgi:hypothetical protein
MPTRSGLIILLMSVALVTAGCRPAGQKVRIPLPEAPQSLTPGPASELENQATSTPMVIPNVPPIPIQVPEIKPVPPPQPETPIAKPKPQRTQAVNKKEVHPAHAAEPPVVVPPSHAPAIQLGPLITNKDKDSMKSKINDQLDSADRMLKSINPSKLDSQQKANYEAIHDAILDFITKSKDALDKEDYNQSLLMAQKANTLAASLVKP